MFPDLFASQSPTVTSVPVPLWIDLCAVVVGSLSGILYARDRHLDLVGFVAMAIICGLGGGLIRDTIMQVGDVYMLQSRWAIPVSIAAGIVGFLFPSSVSAHPQLLEWTDIISVGLFAAAGTDKAILYHLSPAAVILMGTITGVGGGMLRDIIVREVPNIFRSGNWYALCAIAGSIVYYFGAVGLMLDKAWAALACVLVTLVLRRISLRFRLYSPVDVDLAPAVKRVGQSVAQTVKESGMAEGERLIERQKQGHGPGTTAYGSRHVQDE